MRRERLPQLFQSDKSPQGIAGLSELSEKKKKKKEAIKCVIVRCSIGPFWQVIEQDEWHGRFVPANMEWLLRIIPYSLKW